MGSAHPLVDVNISDKFEENPSICIGLIETDRPTTFCGGGIINTTANMFLLVVFSTYNV